MKTVLLVGLGGFLGSASRYGVQLLIDRTFISNFPTGTYVVNVVGCLLIGLIYGFAEREHLLHHESRLFLAVGFCGSFTTFSTFAHENLKLFHQGHINIILLYTGLSVIVGILFTYLGYLLARSI